MPPLDEIAAHHANNGGILAQFPTNDGKLLLMPQMQGVIFADNANSFQKNPSFTQNRA
jgi:hypothetical protein